MVFKWSSNEKGNLFVVQKFLEAFNTKHLVLTNLSFHTHDKRKTTLTFEQEVNAVVKDGADLFIVVKKCSDPDGGQKNLLDSPMQSAVSSPLHPLSKTKTESKAGNLAERELKGNVLNSTTRFALPDLKKVDSVREAACICAQALQVEDNYSALVCLAEIYLEAGRPNLSLEYIEPALKVYPSDPGLSFILGNCLADAGRLEEATNAYIKYMGHLEASGASKRQIHDVQAAIAKIFAKEGKVQMARQLFADVLREAHSHVESLRGFALHTAENCQEDLHEAIAVLMSTLVHSKSNRDIRKQVAELLS